MGLPQAPVVTTFGSRAARLVKANDTVVSTIRNRLRSLQFALDMPVTVIIKRLALFITKMAAYIYGPLGNHEYDTSMHLAEREIVRSYIRAAWSARGYLVL